MTDTDQHHPADELDDLPEEALIAERAVVGAAVLSRDAAVRAVSVLRPEHFRVGAHQIVFEAVDRLVDAGVTVKTSVEWQTAVLGEVAKTGMLDRIGVSGLGYGGAFLVSLTQLAGSVDYHAPKIISAARTRNIMAALRSAAHMATRSGFEPAEQAEQIRQLVEDACGWSEASVLHPNSEVVDEVLAEIEAGGDPGLPTGFADLDAVLGGFRSKELIVIGARPGVGKTTIGLQFAENVVAKTRVPVLFVSAEMPEKQLTMRRVSSAAKVPLHRLVHGTVASDEWDRIDRAHDKLVSGELYIDDTSSPSVGHIRARLRELYRQGIHVRLLVIDYLGFLQAPRAESRQLAVAELVKSIKRLAQEFELPVVLLAQLNRGSEQRSDKVPTLTDLRESGEIEQTADVVILLHREDAANRESPRAGELDMILAKNRQGPTCTITVCFQGHYARVVDMAPDSWSPSAAAERAA